ncbi:putative palmitoyltransferase ZDHHC24 [Labeo rohita]|uniref:Palmitoyltransferase ZDHHC24 n=1 Tax=Labeo rohita TaxID=84645 RepID=A0ABQ8LXY0_LABRO|nr:putative palmitoyltransferase ZDHHC24 [Labeo rohita]
MSFKIALGLLLLAMLAMVAESSWGKEKGPYSYDLSNKSDLNMLYNSKVYLAELFRRPLEGMSSQLGLISHSGVRVTLQDGSKWLVHKGNNFGISSQTIVAGGTDYQLLFDNCHKAANQMMRD